MKLQEFNYIILKLPEVGRTLIFTIIINALSVQKIVLVVYLLILNGNYLSSFFFLRFSESFISIKDQKENDLKAFELFSFYGELYFSEANRFSRL